MSIESEKAHGVRALGSSGKAPSTESSSCLGVDTSYLPDLSSSRKTAEGEVDVCLVSVEWALDPLLCDQHVIVCSYAPAGAGLAPQARHDIVPTHRDSTTV